MNTIALWFFLLTYPNQVVQPEFVVIEQKMADAGQCRPAECDERLTARLLADDVAECAGCPGWRITAENVAEWAGVSPPTHQEVEEVRRQCRLVLEAKRCL